MRIELRHFASFSHQAVQSVALLVDHLKQVLALRLVKTRLGQQRFGGSLDRGQWRPKFMGNRIEQHRSEPIAFARSLAFRQLLNRVGPLDRDGDQAADGFEALARKIATGYGERAHGSHSHAQGDVADPMLAIEHWLAAITDRLKLVERKQTPARAVEEISILFPFDKDCGSTDPERVDDVLGNDVQQFKGIFRQPQLLAEGVQSLEFTPAIFRRQGATACALGKLARDYSRNQKGQKGNPVLRICNGETEQWWQEEVVISYRSQDGCECGVAQTPVCRDEQDRQ